MKIIEIAKTYIGKKEKPNNSGFEDPVFESEMITRGWIKGYAWCSLFAELIASKAYPEEKEMIKLFHAGAVKTFDNFKEAGYKITTYPVPGSIVVWQHYENGLAQWMGHVGIVSDTLSDTMFHSIEGNGSFDGSRNGDRVVEKLRTTQLKRSGLNIKGFITIPKLPK